MNLVEREIAYRKKWRRMAMRGDWTAMSNLAASYRLVGNHRAAFHWYQRAAQLNDGDCSMELGYLFLGGLGVRKNMEQSEQAFRAAISSSYISPFSREEAMYGLAVLNLLTKREEKHRETCALLRRASADHDYPQAEDLLDRLKQGVTGPICICRREMMRRIATLRCPIHRHGAGKRRTASADDASRYG